MTHKRGRSETQVDYSQDTWISLLFLLRPIEFFVTVDHFPIWRRHLAWAMTSGSDLRTHIMQRFSSNMVFMSLLLGAELGVLFNSSEIATDMRKAMKNEHYGDLKYWIGVTIILSVCVTITALVATFTAWGMISSISDANVRCVIRSSIGQYVTQLPPNLVVTSLYLFLFWVVLFLVDMLSGVMMLIVMLVVGTLFFQVVIAYSAFGRLIVYTGAMGKKPVMPPELEQALLPSGLHACLLIKATTRKKKRTSVVALYRNAKAQQSAQRRRPNVKDRQHSTQSTVTSTNSGIRKRPDARGEKRKSDDSFVLGGFEEQLIRESAQEFSTPYLFHESGKADSSSSSSHRRQSSDSSSSIELGEMTRKPPLPSPPITSCKEATDEGTGAPATLSPDEGSAEKNFSACRRQALSKAKFSREATARRKSSLLMSRMGSFRVRQEWDNENAAREMYDLPPPPDIPSESEEEFSDHEAMPSASVLNTHVGWKSLRRLVSNSTDDSRAPSLIAGSRSGSNVLTPVFGGNETDVRDNASHVLDEENPLNVGTGEKDRLLLRVDKDYSSVGGK